MRPRRVASVPLWGVSTVAAMCAAGIPGCVGSDTDEALAGPEPVPVAGCAGESYAACDIRQRPCQLRILSLMACVRGSTDPELPPVAMISAGDYRELVAAGFAQATEEELAESALYERGLVLSGLAKPEELTAANRVDQLAESVVASYSHIDKSIIVIEPDTEAGRSDTVGNMLTLGHELVHALQDQENDLDSYATEHSAAYDDYLASRAVPEGEAELLTAFYATALWGLAPEQVDYPGRFMSWVPSVQEHLAEGSPLLSSPLYFPYSYGARYVFNVHREGGTDAVKSLYAAPPTATLSVMLSESAVSDVGAAPWQAAPPTAPEGYELQGEDVFGAWIIEQLLARYADREESAALARQWRGDRWYLFASDAGSVAVAWQLAFVDGNAAAHFVNLLTPTFAGSAWAASWIGTGAVIAAADDPAVLAAWDMALADPWAPESGNAATEVDSAARVRLVRLLKRKLEARLP